MIESNVVNLGKQVVIWPTLLMACFIFGYLAVRSPFIGILLIGAIGSLLVYVIAPHWMVWIALFSAFATMPAGVPAGKLVGGTVIFLYEALTLLAIGFLVLLQRNRTPLSALPGIFLMFMILPTITGILNGNERAWIIFEARNLIMMAAAFVLAELLIRFGLTAQAVRFTSVLLWFSAAMILANAFFNVQLRRVVGAVSGAGGAEIAGGAVRRYFTETQSAAFAVLVILIVVSVIVGVRFKYWFMLGVPALMINFLSFTRFSLVGLLGALILAGLVGARRTTLIRIAKFSAISFAAIFILALLFQLSSSFGTGGWIGQQIQAYVTRIFGGLMLFLEGGDTSYGARQAENVNLWIAIREAPLFGHGFGYAYQQPFGSAGQFAATFGPYYGHNFYLWLLAKAGIVGLLGFAIFALIPIARALRSASVEAKASAVLAAMILVVSTVSPAGESGQGSIVLGIALGAAMTLGSWPATAVAQNAGFRARPGWQDMPAPNSARAVSHLQNEAH